MKMGSKIISVAIFTVMEAHNANSNVSTPPDQQNYAQNVRQSRKDKL